MKIFSKAIATGKEWKPCIECGQVFEWGEIISSLSTDEGFSVTYWYCYKCIEGFFCRVLYAERNPDYICSRIDRLINLEESNNHVRYARYSNIERWSLN